MNVNDAFFSGSYKFAWKDMMPDQLSDAEVELILGILKKTSDIKVLDVMCGAGRHALRLSEKGANVLAVDNLDHYIGDLQVAATANGLSLIPMLANVSNLHLNETFDAVICMGNSFSFFDPNQARALVKKIGNWLSQDGVFILNTWSIAEISFKHFKRSDWHKAGNYIAVLENDLKFLPTRIETRQRLICPDGRVEVSDGVDYIYSINELSEMLLAGGLSIVGLFSTPRQRIFKEGDTQIYIVASKA